MEPGSPPRAGGQGRAVPAILQAMRQPAEMADTMAFYLTSLGKRVRENQDGCTGLLNNVQEVVNEALSRIAALEASELQMTTAIQDQINRQQGDYEIFRNNVIQAEEFANGNGFNILVQGERGRRSSQYLLWKADQTGSITDRSRWQTGEDLAFDGYEPIFGVDFNNNGSIGI